MWGTAWGSRPPARSSNCLNLNLRSFLCRSTNYHHTHAQICRVSARRFGQIVPGHPPAGLHWKTYAAINWFLFASVADRARAWGINCELAAWKVVRNILPFPLFFFSFNYCLNLIPWHITASNISEHILIISISQRKCVITAWYFLRDTFTVWDMVSLTSGTYLLTLFGGVSHVMTRLYVCSVTPRSLQRISLQAK